MTEHLDAMEAVEQVPIEDRTAFKYALGPRLVKNNAHWRAFETVFDVYFSARAAGWSTAGGADGDDEGTASWQPSPSCSTPGTGRPTPRWRGSAPRS